MPKKKATQEELPGSDELKRRFEIAPDSLGATGRYPEGKLNEHDEGEIRFAVAADPIHKKVLIDFGKPVAFLGMTGEQAKALGQMLIDKASQL